MFVLAILETHFVCFFSTVATSLSIYLLRLVGGSIPLFSLLVFFNVPVFFLLVCSVTQQIFSSFVRVCVCRLFGKSWKNCRKDGILLLQVVSMLKATTSWKYLQGYLESHFCDGKCLGETVYELKRADFSQCTSTQLNHSISIPFGSY